MALIQGAKKLVNNAVKQILAYQSGQIKPIQTRFPHFNVNCIGGIHKGMIITIAGISGSGKTYALQQIEEDIFNKKLNPNCDNHILLRCNWEMSVFKLILRKLKRNLKVGIKALLTTPPTEQQLPQFKSVCDSERSDQIFYLEDPTTAEQWYKLVREFLTQQEEKKHIIITIDHIALIRDSASNKKKAIDDLIGDINSLKKEFTNVSFIIVSQLNREIEARTDVKRLAPQRSDLYSSDTMYHISDIVIVIHNPYKLGYDKYMLIPGLAQSPSGQTINDKYMPLSKYMISPESKKTNFFTEGILFWHYLKVREEEDDYMDVAVEEINFKKPIDVTFDEADFTDPYLQ